MNQITLCKQDRYRYISELTEAQQSFLLAVLRDALLANDTPDAELGAALEAAQASKVVDLEDTLQINYIDKSRDLGDVQPITAEQPFADYNQILDGRLPPLLVQDPMKLRLDKFSTPFRDALVSRIKLAEEKRDCPSPPSPQCKDFPER